MASPMGLSQGKSSHNGNGSTVRHHLPQMLPMATNPRLAVSKTASKEDAETDSALPNFCPDPEAVKTEESPMEMDTETKHDVKPCEAKADENENTAVNNIPSKPSPGTPIKLRIRNSVKADKSLVPEPSEAPVMGTPVEQTQTPVADKTAALETPEVMSDPGPRARKTGRLKGRRKGRPKGSVSQKKLQSVVEGSTSTPPAPAATKLSADAPPKWLVGDLVWAKVSGHPWWPCMISYDPVTGIYMRSKGTRMIRQYHMQFFGEIPERGWVSEASTIQFEGKDAFIRYREEKMASAPSLSQKKVLGDKYKLDLASGRKGERWEGAYKSAMKALNLNRNERKQQYTFVYEPAKPVQPPPVAETPSSVVNDSPAADTQKTKRGRPKLNGHLTTNAARKRKLREALAAHTDSNQPTKKRRTKSLGSSLSGAMSPELKPVEAPKALADQSATQFMVYCQKRRESVKTDHPDYGPDQVEACLKEQWDRLDDEQQRRFIPMGSDVSHLSAMFPGRRAVSSGTKRSPRISRPSKKVLEAVQDTLAFMTPTSTRRRRSCGTSGSYKECDDDMPDEEDIIRYTSEPDIDDIISRVAAGEGVVGAPGTEAEDIQGLLDKEVSSTTAAAPPKKRGRKPKVVELPEEKEAPSDDAASQTSTESKDSGMDAIKKTISLDGDDEYKLQIFKLMSTGSQKKEPLCTMCEQPGQLINCLGPCGQSFHTNCLGLTAPPAGEFKCDECASGIHACFSCKQTDSTVQKCSRSMCGKFYHEACLKKSSRSRVEGKNLICPLHACATCLAEDSKSTKALKGRFYRCVRCPTAYHVGEHCIAAGSINLAGVNIVCSNHFQPVKTQSHHSHIHVSWCFLCSKGPETGQGQGGTLLCCENCPAAFHADCLKISPPEGSWYCSECTAGKKPLYGDIIWVKLGSYRWWPGEICVPRDVPLNIQGMPHQVGEFPVRFFGSHDYYWSHQARVFLFQEGDKGSSEGANAKGLARIFKKAVTEATLAFKIWQAAKECKEQQEMEKSERKPPPYKHVRTNVPIGSVQIQKADLASIPCCECKKDSENPCGSDVDCINRMMMYECHPAVCPAGESCQNQRFHKRQYPHSIPFKTDKRGWGLKTLVNVKRGEFVNEYVGDLIDEEECHKRIKKAHEENISNFYMLTVDKNRIIDAGPKGNLSRFMNHSCQPNLETQKWTVAGEVRVGLFAIKEIPAGTELTFNYNLDCLGNEKTACQCGASICSGFLGVRPKTDAAAAVEKKMKEGKKKKKKKKGKMTLKREHEDECYRCEEGGELVMCDKGNCPKAYHLHCLNLTKPPHGQWMCPWHHCDICGARSVKLCEKCPNSFCSAHMENNIVDMGDNRLFCSDHEDIINTFRATGKPPERSNQSRQAGNSSQDNDTASSSSSEESEEAGTSASCSSRESEEIKPEVTMETVLQPSHKKSRASSNGSKPKRKQSRGTPAGNQGKKGKRQQTPKVQGPDVKVEPAIENKGQQGPAVTQAKQGNKNGTIIEPMFDDEDDDDMGKLIIDIPNV